MDARFSALQEIAHGVRKVRGPFKKKESPEYFGEYVFSPRVMKQMLPQEIYANISKAMNSGEQIKLEYADSIALAMKEWALSLGATHFTHLFQPLTGATAEKHDAFIELNSDGIAMDRFSGKQLVQGEPDASSFPSGGLRSTYEARGYTGWDPSSPAFLWQGGDGLTLCIPSVFFSWDGAVLDHKIPLLRSDRMLNEVVMRLLRLTGIEAGHTFSTLGLEQEYFIVDRRLRQLRPDLVLSGKTVFGCHPPKGQELQDHYFASVKDRILSYMQDFEERAAKIGIPLKTRHNEVAPGQHEVAHLFEKSSRAIDHNIVLMELMRQTAMEHNLSCLLHEKPFKDVNGSGKHANWSLMTDTGINLLDPTDTPENTVHFLVLLTAIVTAVHRHSSLLRASIASSSNDCRLGGHEAPPAIISVYLGEELESLLNEIESKGVASPRVKKGGYAFGISSLPDLTRDNTDRNRTSPFAFTGNKFEFRAVGSSSNVSFPTTVLNTAVAEVLDEMLGAIEERKKRNETVSMMEVCAPVIQKYLTLSKPIRFSGDNYSPEWRQEAEKRGLPHLKNAPEAFEALASSSTISLMDSVLSEGELKSRQEIYYEVYCKEVNIECNLMLELFWTMIVPEALDYQKKVAHSLTAVRQAIGQHDGVRHQAGLLKRLNDLVEEGLRLCEEIQEKRQEALQLDLKRCAQQFSGDLLKLIEQLRNCGDELETLVPDGDWPLPKYRELLFLV